MTDRDALIEAVTREVIAALAVDDDCTGDDCAVHSSEKVRAIVANGASRVTFSGRAAEVPADLHRYIDHTLLKPEATRSDVDRICDEAVEYQFASVMINPSWVKHAAQRLKGTGVAVGTVVGFPLGAHTPEVKAMETRQALRDGATEIDMVINIGALKSGLYDVVRHDIARVTDAVRETGAITKVILETALLTDEEKVIASRLAKEAKADFVKTSTGFSSAGATVFDVALMREAVGPSMGVKAAGGIRTQEDMEDMIAAGATRIGASAGVSIMQGKASDGNY
ncbi:MAG: deoxyribose-phosphate aldolase [Acidimicrobiia bacterium]|nr:deoxyribose-phosphate aldolase [Acidimicrobiia bacterium]MBT8216107.1 deoxyribose-phosphate aldolase [Acidimicrobiia bacterium]NNF09886.1 deoxyribose-phosphate aldolase [Acidimicrobiia bacterium]NNL70513.1 deoxyribose-phosphate aldolase [Acidimicrobiia bacterium]